MGEVIEISSDEEEYDEPETFYQGHVATTSTSPAPESSSGAKSILKRKMQTEETFATPKTARYGTWEPAKAADNDDAEMSDAPEMVEKPKREKWKGVHFADPPEANISRPMSSGMASPAPERQVIKASKPGKIRSDQSAQAENPDASLTTESTVEPGLQCEEICMRILREGKISLSFEDMVRMSPVFAKYLRGITARPKSKASSPPAARVNSLGVGQDDERLYVAKTPRAVIRLNGELCKALIDTGAEINVMTEEARDRCNLPIRMEPNLRLISHTGHRRDFIGVCEDVDVSVGGAVTKQNIFVVDSADHVLVLGTPFIIKSQARMDWDHNGCLVMTCYSSDGTSTAVSKVLDRKLATGPTEAELFPTQSLN